MAIASSSSTADQPIMTLPSGPKMPPIVQLVNWISRPYPFLNDCSRQYGDLFTVRLQGLSPLVFCSRPETIQAIFKANPNRFEAGSTNGLLRPLVGDESILSLDGDRHQRQRQLLMPPFHGDRMRTYAGIIRALTRQVMDAQPRQHPFPVRPAMQDISLTVILQAVFGLEATAEGGDRYTALHQQLSELLDMTGSPISSTLLFVEALQRDWGAWTPWGRFVRKRAAIDQMLYAEIRQRQQTHDPERQDILSLLLSARDENGQPMTEVELRDELMTLLLAGHETTASALTWALYWIHHLPHVRDRLLGELSDVDLQDAGAIARLPYLNAICQETLRIYPIAPITFPRRVVNEPFDLQGHRFPPETLLAPCIYLVHRRPDLYPEPEQFRPERFLERQFSPYEFLPFGGSNRRCIGMAFALFEMKWVLATIVQHYTLDRPSDRSLTPVRRGVTLAPPGSFELQIRH